jgi:hypothetical protein
MRFGRQFAESTIGGPKASAFDATRFATTSRTMPASTDGDEETGRGARDSVEACTQPTPARRRSAGVRRRFFTPEGYSRSAEADSTTHWGNKTALYIDYIEVDKPKP